MIFSQITDPRGYSICCSKERWDDHILVLHPEMVGFEEEVKLTIQKPSLPIFQDVDYQDRNVYYYTYRANRDKRKYIRVIVSIDEDKKTGYVVTAFMTYNVKPNERKIWP